MNYKNESMVWGGVSFVLRNLQLREMTPENLDTLKSATDSPWPSSHPHRDTLQQAKKLRVRGNYDEATNILLPIYETDSADAHVALELQRVCHEQGYLKKAMDCSAGVAKVQPISIHEEVISKDTSAAHLTKDARRSSPIARALLLMISNYLRCFVHGRWEAALAEAAELFDKYLLCWNPENEDVSLLVS
jgi:hypothetical protein